MIERSLGSARDCKSKHFEKYGSFITDIGALRRHPLYGIAGHALLLSFLNENKIMTQQNKITFQFISEPTHVNFGGNVHGGVVMKWIDQTAFACAANWGQSYCVTVYVGGIRFYRPIRIGDINKIDATIIYTGNTSMHIAIDVYSKEITGSKFSKKTHCVIVFVCVDEKGKPTPVKKWIPITEKEKQLESYAIKLKALREHIESEMRPFFSDSIQKTDI